MQVSARVEGFLECHVRLGQFFSAPQQLQVCLPAEQQPNGNRSAHKRPGWIPGWIILLREEDFTHQLRYLIYFFGTCGLLTTPHAGQHRQEGT